MPEPIVEFCRTGAGARIAYASAGTGPPLVMVPGWLSHVTALWSHPAAGSALAKLTADHRFIWYDRLGCGLSDRDVVSLTLDDDVDQLITVLDAAGVDRCDLVGYSFGGPVGALFATRHPERVRHLVLYSTYVRGADLAPEEAYGALVGLVRSGWSLAALSLAAVFLPSGGPDDLRWFSRFQRLAASPETAAALLEYLRRHDVSDVLPRLRVPTTVITARNDRAVPPANAEAVAKATPGARLLVLDGATHDPFIRDAADVVEAILASVEGRPFLPAAPPARPATLGPTLTDRELEVLRLLATGASNKAIARDLGLGIATVERHLTNVYRKLGASGRADAAVHAVSRGLVTGARG